MASVASSDAPRSKGDLQRLDPRRFEELVAELWRADGWDVEVMPPGPDDGIDAIATRAEPFNQKQVIQAKRYSDTNPITGPQIQQYASLKQQVKGADIVVVVTTGRFTDSAVARAHELNVKLIDGEDLEQMVREASVSEDVEPERQGRGPPADSSSPEPATSNDAEPASLLLVVPYLLLEGAWRLVVGVATVIGAIGGILLLFSFEEWVEIVRILIFLIIGGFVVWSVLDIVVFNGALPG